MSGLYHSTIDAQPSDGLWPMTGARPLDESMDFAARVSRSTVGEFLAGIVRDDDGEEAVRITVEFLVPPASVEHFIVELDRAFSRRSMEYSVLRRTGELGPVRVDVVPAGTFHQWRLVWRVHAEVQHARRWSADAQMLAGVSQQGKMGWSELAMV